MSQVRLGSVLSKQLGFLLGAALAACTANQGEGAESAEQTSDVPGSPVGDDTSTTGLTDVNGQPTTRTSLPSAIDLPGAPSTGTGLMTRARALTEKLGAGHAGHFLIGMGEDRSSAAYTMGVPFDMHYNYLSGTSTSGGWPTWNQNPNYVELRMRQAKPHNQVPMFSYYGLAANGDGNLGAMTDSAFVRTYLKDFTLALDSMKREGGPVILHIEPDFWGYVTQAATMRNIGVDQIAVTMSGNAPDCPTAANNAVGFASCLISMARTRAPNALIGFQASGFGTNYDVPQNKNPSYDVVGEAKKLASMMRALGADKTDFLVVDPSDRDAGCYEVGYVKNGQTVCSKDPSRLWDEQNVRLPNFRQYFTWLGAMHEELKLPTMIWQIPYGEPKADPGGPGAWRDNKSKYFMEHVSDLVKAGCVGAAWGNGAPDQTDPTTAFQSRARDYFTSPLSL